MGAAGRGFGDAAADLLATTPAVVSFDGGLATVLRAEGVLVVSVDAPTSTSDNPPSAAPPLDGPPIDGPPIDGAPIDGAASSHSIGTLLAQALADTEHDPVRSVVLELSASRVHDGGAGLLAGLGAVADVDLTAGVAGLRGITEVDLRPVRELLGDASLTLVVAADEQPLQLTGLRGITSVKGHGADPAMDPADLLATDQALVDFARAAEGSPTNAGSGACGGVGFAVQVLGGRVLTGSQWCSERARLDETVRASDVVVTGGGQLDFGTMGGEVLALVSAAGQAALRPVVVIAGSNFVSPRELRGIGIEAAHSVRPGTDDVDTITAEEITRASLPVAGSWTW